MRNNELAYRKRSIEVVWKRILLLVEHPITLKLSFKNIQRTVCIEQLHRQIEDGHCQYKEIERDQESLIDNPNI